MVNELITNFRMCKKKSKEPEKVKTYLPGSIISAARCSELLDRENSDS